MNKNRKKIEWHKGRGPAPRSWALQRPSTPDPGGSKATSHKDNGLGMHTAQRTSHSLSPNQRDDQWIAKVLTTQPEERSDHFTWCPSQCIPTSRMIRAHRKASGPRADFKDSQECVALWRSLNNNYYY